ncbi:MAG: WecB/TagA/CpsF family glycosyltransferase [Chloroflexota bacterium]
MRELLIILGIPIDDLDMNSALVRIDNFITDGRKTHKTHQIATVNADFVVKARHDPELRRILQESDMATADGMPLVWGARMLGMPLNGRVTGADLVPALAERAAQEGYSLFLLGAAPGVAARAADILTERHPGLKIAGVLSPPKASLLEMDPSIIDTVRAAQPDILLVAFGSPKQEKWIAMHAPELHVPVAIGVGGTLDFIAGQTKRAPLWMQRTGLEWIFRLIQEPRRLFRRYVSDMLGFIPFFARQWWLMRQGQEPETVALPKSNLILVREAAILNVNGRLERSTLTNFNNHASVALSNSDKIIVNLEQATFVDSTGLGALVNLHKQTQERGKLLAVTAVPPNIAKAMSLLKLDLLLNLYPSTDDVLKLAPAAAEPSSSQGKWRVLPAPARLDALTAPAFYLAAQTELQTCSHLILDLRGTTFLASAGMAMIARLAREATAKNGEVRLAGSQGDVARTIELMNLHKVLPVFSDMAAAAI